MGTEENKQIVRDWVESGWNRGQFDMLATHYSPSYTPHWLPPGFPPGRDGLRAFVGVMRAGVPDLHFELADLVAEEDRVVWRFISTGTHNGELFGVPPTGKSISVQGIVIARIEDGLWMEDWVNFDELGMLRQLGVIPEQQPATA